MLPSASARSRCCAASSSSSSSYPCPSSRATRSLLSTPSSSRGAARRTARAALPLVGRRAGVGGFLLLAPAMFTSSASPAAAAASRMPEGAAASILESAKYPEEFPFTAADFARYDETKDSIFYSQPRFVTHIDDGAIGALTEFYKRALPSAEGARCLDMCSSWISHYPKGYAAGKTVVGMGMNADELSSNPILSEFVVQDLNETPKIPFPDEHFDCITNTVSVDYLSRPLEVFREMHRVLKPGGKAYMSFSNRCFPTKAIAIWTSTGDADHIFIVGSYFHYSGFSRPIAEDISPKPSFFKPGGDPMYVVYAQK